jgi:hypothetical protein
MGTTLGRKPCAPQRQRTPASQIPVKVSEGLRLVEEGARQCRQPAIPREAALSVKGRGDQPDCESTADSASMLARCAKRS